MEWIDVRLLAPIATAIAASISTYLWFLNKSKNLSYEIVRNQSLINVKGGVRQRIKVTFDQHQIANVELVVIRLISSGHVAIVPGDYQVPVSIRLNSDAHILTADVVETNPGDLDDRFRTTEGATQLVELQGQSKLVIKPILLNPGDSVTLQLLVKNYSSIVSISGHISGVRQIAQLKQRDFIPTLLTQFGAFVMAGAMVMLKPESLMRFKYVEILPFVLLCMLGYVFLWAGITIPKREKIFESSTELA
jgi:hypothetical protein